METTVQTLQASSTDRTESFDSAAKEKFRLIGLAYTKPRANIYYEG